MMSPAQFLKIAPYLHNYFVLIGFIVSVVTGVWLVVIKSPHLSRLSRSQTTAVLLSVLRYGFRFGIVSMVLGLMYTGYHRYQNSSQTQIQPAPVQQQSGDCSAVQNGTGNTASVNCTNKTAGAK